jgi:hypothetical protein
LPAGSLAFFPGAPPGKSRSRNVFWYRKELIRFRKENTNCSSFERESAFLKRSRNPIAFETAFRLRVGYHPEPAPLFHNEFKFPRVQSPSVNAAFDQDGILLQSPGLGEAKDSPAAWDIFSLGIATCAFKLLNPFDSNRQVIRSVRDSPADFLGEHGLMIAPRIGIRQE